MTAKPETAVRTFQHWKPGPAAWFTAVLLGILVGSLTPSRYSADGISFTFRDGGHPGALTFVIRDSHDRPLPGVTVMSESFSGTTKKFITDASGAATIEPGEVEVLAVYIANHEFRLRSRNAILEMQGPDCNSGLTFNVIMRNG